MQGERFYFGKAVLVLIVISLEAIYYMVGIAAILCSAAYKIGYEIGKNTKK